MKDMGSQSLSACLHSITLKEEASGHWETRDRLLHTVTATPPPSQGKDLFSPWNWHIFYCGNHKETWLLGTRPICMLPSWNLKTMLWRFYKDYQLHHHLEHPHQLWPSDSLKKNADWKIVMICLYLKQWNLIKLSSKLLRHRANKSKWLKCFSHSYRWVNKKKMYYLIGGHKKA